MKRKPSFRTALDIADPADLVRRVDARRCLIYNLLGDHRVKHRWREWALTDAGQLAIAKAVLSLDRAAVDDVTDLLPEVPDIGRDILTALPPRSWPAWLLPWLGRAAIRVGCSVVTGAVPPALFLHLTTPWAERRRRASKRQAAGSGPTTMGRDVGWFYRAELAAPRVSIRQLGQEYSSSSRGVVKTDARSVVRDAIRRAKIALEMG